jgi:hypothetical protein
MVKHSDMKEYCSVKHIEYEEIAQYYQRQLLIRSFLHTSVIFRKLLLK